MRSSRSASLISRASRALAAPLLPLLVAVDIGHFQAAPGALSAAGKPEYEFNRELASEVQGTLEAAGFTVRMIESHPQLEARTREAEGADLFVSIHHDSVKPQYLPDARWYSGFSLFVSRLNPQPEKSLACASAIGAQLRAAGFFASRYHADPVFGESRPFADDANGVHYFDDLAVARSASMPSVLIEAGVIVNPAEELRIQHPVLRRRFAEAVARGVKQCLP